MWCRAVLATALAITYIVCVLILNGLQKEDLDVNTLKKLERFNVNIEDMNNGTLRRECETVTRIRSQNVEDPYTHKTFPLDMRDKQEDKIKLNDSNIQNIIINYFNNVPKTNKPNYNENLKNEEPYSSTDLPNVEKFINVRNMLTITKRDDVESTTKAIESSTALIDRTIRSNMRSDDKSVEYINKILEKLMAGPRTTTTKRPTTSVDFDIIAQKIRDILTNTSNNENNSPTRLKIVLDKFSSDKVIEEKEVSHNDSIQHIDDIIKLTNLFEMFRSVRNKNTGNKNIHIEDKNEQYQTKRKYMVDEVGPFNIISKAPMDLKRYKNHFINSQIKSLSKDIIREITESVRARVLQDLQKIITTTARTKIATRSTTMESTTAKQAEKSTTIKEKHEPKYENIDATDMIGQFMQMFQQFKASKDLFELSKVKMRDNKNSRSNNNAQISYLPAANNYDFKPLPVNITSVIINPFNQIHTPLIPSAVLPNEPYTLININTPIQNIPLAKPLHKITQLNIFNTKNNYRTSPITIQTNSMEVPPLGLPAQQSVVYQNIVVSTKHPLHKGRHDLHQSYSLQDRTQYDIKHDKPPYSPQSKDLYSQFGMSRHDGSRDFFNEEYSKEINRRKPIKYNNYGPPHHSDHNIERFHEKLERTDDWPRITRPGENINIDYDTPKLISRHQLPLGSAKQRSRYDDAHFRKFLQTQQKVNDMLERILATKTIANGPRSVETTV